MRHALRWLACFFLLIPAAAESGENRPNVLFIAADDLRPELGCYGSAHVRSPQIDKLATQGTLFTHAYCQQTLCNPSRASLLTGLRPDTLRIWDLPTHFRTHRPDVVTLPQMFMQQGYFAQGIGKIFHNFRQDAWKGDPASWSVPAMLHYENHGNDKPQIDGELPPDLATLTPAECRDVPDSAYYDGRVADAAVAALRDIKSHNQPFFLAVGFWKPHTPFNAPKAYWDLYDRDAIPLPQNLDPPANAPEIALTSDRFDGRAHPDQLRELHHAHLACISYMDAQVGRVLDELDRLSLRENTIIVFWSDHGLHIGEHGLEKKTTAFELDAHVPLIIAAPGHQGGRRTDVLVELLDLYPTLADLCGLTPPAGLEGISLAPLLSDPQRTVKDFALTQTTRPNYPKLHEPIELMGYSLRTPQYRYIEWRDFKTGEARERELYDMANDPLETANIAGRAEQAATLEVLAVLLERVRPKAGGSAAALTAYPDPVKNPDAPLMLTGAWVPDDPAKIDFEKLPKVPSRHVVITDVRASDGVSQHNYLTHHAGKYWIMWSDGPGKEDRVGQRVKFSTSADGLHWSDPEYLTPVPPGSGPDSPHYGTRSDKGLRWISRGFWQRDGALYALASLDEAAGFFGPSLALHAFRYDADERTWTDMGVIADDTINNFPPERLPSGEWMMSRRKHDYQTTGAHFLVGGTSSIDAWESFPVFGTSSELAAEEPQWWTLPDGSLMALFRDNRKSRRIYRSFSTDNGRTWSAPIKTNFPDATSKMFGLRLSDGRYILISNPNPARRDPLSLAISSDGLVFDKLAWLFGGRRIDYPHALEHDGHLLVAFNGDKQTIELVKFPLTELDRIEMPASVE